MFTLGFKKHIDEIFDSDVHNYIVAIWENFNLEIPVIKELIFKFGNHAYYYIQASNIWVPGKSCSLFLYDSSNEVVYLWLCVVSGVEFVWAGIVELAGLLEPEAVQHSLWDAECQLNIRHTVCGLASNKLLGALSKRPRCCLQWSECLCGPQNSYAEILTPKREFRLLGGAWVMRVDLSWMALVPV